ncbi:MAG: FlgD immunoglobulin-like domain containing protein, partial [Actinomycetota bacterium]|nr:FlgD immunoglobulin-like domain containing protein [Actinomycetota bacterium]
VFSCADWGGKRVPVLVFDAAGNLQQATHSTLLPATRKRAQSRPVTALQARPFSCSAEGESGGRIVEVSYDASAGSVTGAYVYNGNGELVRVLSPATSPLTWDGRDEDGDPVADGTYTVYLTTRSPDPSVHMPAATTRVGANTNIPTPSTTWYLAEGYTGSNTESGEFDTWVLIQNPGDQANRARVTFMLPGGDNVTREYSLHPRSRFTIHVDDILPAAEMSTLVESDLPVVVERAMYFGGGLAGHDTIGVNAPSRRWYLAEGYTGGDFDEWVLVQNPNHTPAQLKVQFQTQEQGVVDRSYGLEPRSRFTIHVDDILPDSQVSTYLECDLPVVVERAQYLNYMNSGHCSIGARSPSTTWYLAEGYTGGGFEEWLLVQNPQDGAARVEITFMELDGTNTRMEFDVPGRSRYTVPVHDFLPGAQVSALATSSRPVICERAMYWNGRSDGHATIGTPTPEYSWYFPEGYTAGGYEEWLLIQNPWDTKAVVSVEFMLPGGSSQSIQLEVAARSRFSLNVGGIIGETEVSLRVSSDLPVVSERAMYWRERYGGHCSIGAMQ